MTYVYVVCISEYVLEIFCLFVEKNMIICPDPLKKNIHLNIILFFIDFSNIYELINV